MLEDLIVETEAIDRTTLSEQEKVIIDCIESTSQIINFDLTGNDIFFNNKDYWVYNWWDLKNERFNYSSQIYQILEEKYSYNYQKIDDLVKDVLLKYYKIKVTTTTRKPGL